MRNAGVTRMGRDPQGLDRPRRSRGDSTRSSEGGCAQLFLHLRRSREPRQKDFHYPYGPLAERDHSMAKRKKIDIFTLDRKSRSRHTCFIMEIRKRDTTGHLPVPTVTISSGTTRSTEPKPTASRPFAPCSGIAARRARRCPLILSPRQMLERSQALALEDAQHFDVFILPVHAIEIV